MAKPDVQGILWTCMRLSLDATAGKGVFSYPDNVSFLEVQRLERSKQDHRPEARCPRFAAQRAGRSKAVESSSVK